MLRALKTWIYRTYYRFSNRTQWRGKYPDPATSTLQIPGPAGAMEARMYTAAATGDAPLILYFHGGGWVIGDLDTHHPFCQVLANNTGATVIALDYRLAPEHPWPAAQEDCLAAAEWVAARLAELGPNNGGLVISGDSAGGNLTACTCLALSADARRQLRGAATLYPAVDHYQRDWPSYREQGSAKPLTLSLMCWFWDAYLGDSSPEDAMAARPLTSGDLALLPPLFNITAERDPLRDEGRAFAEAASGLGVPVQQRHFANAAHGFACSEGPTEDFNAFMADFRQWLMALA
jgi:acetyl esterase/lipase